MGNTIIEKIIGNHAGREVKPGDMVDMLVDVRVARDFGGANVVKNLEEHALIIDDPGRTFFTFDCNPGGSDQKYATNQQICRIYARKNGIRVYDVDQGIGTHLAIDEGLAVPGATLVSTDSHANILGAVGAFGQGMGDQDIAHAFAFGRVWFIVPPSMKVLVRGMPVRHVSPKDFTLMLLQKFGAQGMLGYSVEMYGEYVDRLSLDARITVSSMATEMGGIIILFPPGEDVIRQCRLAAGGARTFEPVYADNDARYDRYEEIDVTELEPLISRPGHPEDVVTVREIQGTKIDSVFIGSCTNGRLSDIETVAGILSNRKIAPEVVLKVVPSTDRIWRECLKNGIIERLKNAGALIGNSGCAGCAAGQLGQNGPGEKTVSTGNRNFTGKQGKGDVYLASPEVAAASAISGIITTPDRIPSKPAVFKIEKALELVSDKKAPEREKTAAKPVRIKGRVWVIRKDNIDTDMIFHNRHLTVTDMEKMGQYTFGNLAGFEDFPQNARQGDIVIVGSNFGCGSSRQQDVDCFMSIGITVLIAPSFGAIYERNAVNAGMPIMTAPLTETDIENGEEITVDFTTGIIERHKNSQIIKGKPFSDVQLDIYRRGGLLKSR